MPPWIIYALLSAIFAALVAIFGKVGIKNLDTTLSTTIRSIVMAVFLISVTAIFGKFKYIQSINSRALLFIIFAGVAGALSWLFYFNALKSGPASGVAALDRLSVIFVVILALFFLGEHLTWKTGIGAILVTAGAVLMAWK